MRAAELGGGLLTLGRTPLLVSSTALSTSMLLVVLTFGHLVELFESLLGPRAFTRCQGYKFLLRVQQLSEQMAGDLYTVARASSFSSEAPGTI